MNSNEALKSAIDRLKSVLQRKQQELGEEPGLKQQVLARFQPVFSPQNIASLTDQDFRDFLSFKNNRHWPLNKHGHDKAMCADMDLLRHALTILVADGEEPIEKRLNQLLPNGKPPMVPHLGRAVLTAILQVVRPDTYGVLNGTSEGGLRTLSIWPSFDKKDGFGERYVKVNDILRSLAGELKTDLWTLDFVWYGLESTDHDGNNEDNEEKMGFSFECYLRNFLVDNWGKTLLGKEWTLYEKDGEMVGVEYYAGDGRIDLLAHSSEKHKWLVVELKRQQTSDKTVAQILRYMGWVEENLAAKEELVDGIIIAASADERVRLALKHTKNITVLLYEVDFKLTRYALDSVR
jgi:Endonuclease NucS